MRISGVGGRRGCWPNGRPPSEGRRGGLRAGSLADEVGDGVRVGDHHAVGGVDLDCVGAGALGLEALVYAIVFLILVAVWCFAGRYFATRPVIAKALSR